MKWNFWGRKRILGVFLLGGLLISCEDGDQKNFKDGREDYMGKIGLQIIFPEKLDTITYTDRGSESGFPMYIRDQQLTISGIVDDTIRYHKHLQGMKVIMKHTDFQISSKNNIRNFTFNGSAILYLYPYKGANLTDTISGISDTIALKLLPIEGIIEGRKIQFQEKSIQQSELPTDPYMKIQFKGELIPF